MCVVDDCPMNGVNEEAFSKLTDRIQQYCFENGLYDSVSELNESVTCSDDLTEAQFARGIYRTSSKSDLRECVKRMLCTDDCDNDSAQECSVSIDSELYSMDGGKQTVAKDSVSVNGSVVNIAALVNANSNNELCDTSIWSGIGDSAMFTGAPCLSAQVEAESYNYDNRVCYLTETSLCEVSDVVSHWDTYACDTFMLDSVNEVDFVMEEYVCDFFGQMCD